MSCDTLTIISSWASIISLVVSVISVILVGNIRSNIIKFRRKKRLRDLVEDVLRIPSDGVPLSSASKKKIESLGRNLNVGIFECLSEKSKLATQIKGIIKGIDNMTEDEMNELKEVINDWSSYSEDP